MMRLSAVLSQGDTAKIEDQINLMLHMRMKKKRKAAVAMQGFYFYVEMKNRRNQGERSFREDERRKLADRLRQ